MDAPKGYMSVEHDDGKVHALNVAEAVEYNGPVWRATPVCGAATGVSSDEGGREAIRDQPLTCSDCIAILS